jgi:hypothetical protein
MERIVYFTVFAISVLAVTQADSTTQAPTPPPGEWHSYNGTKYFFSAVRASWTEGQAICREIKGTLVEPTSEDVNNWLQDIAINKLRDGMFWMGLIRQNNSFQWQSGDSNAWRNWQLHEPAIDPNAWSVANVAGFWYSTEPFDVLMPVCQQIPDVCEPSPCLNGGNCYADLDDEWHCMCPKGFFGTTCELISAPACPENDTDGSWLLHDNSCFYFEVERAVTWTQAQKECHARGGTLLEVLDAELGDFANANYPCNTPTQCHFWIGLTKKQAYGQSFGWLSGTAVGFTQWAPNQPNGIGWCTRTLGSGPKTGTYAWDAQPCVTVNAGYVCQRTIIHNFKFAPTQAPESTAAPTHGPSTAAPTQGPSSAAPTEGPTSAAPSTGRSTQSTESTSISYAPPLKSKLANLRKKTIISRWHAMHAAKKQ